MSGNWNAQNKVLPGTYINYRGEGPMPDATATRGVAGIPTTFPWLPEQTLVRVASKDAAAMLADFGEAARYVFEAAKNATVVYIFRLNKGTAATVTVGNLKVRAACTGSYGNKLSVSVEAVAGQAGKFYVVTWLDGFEQQRQLVGTIGELQANDWMHFEQAGESGDLAPDAGKPLAGGTDGTVTTSDHVKALEAFETCELNAVACPSSDNDVKQLYTAFAKRMIADEGKYLQVVVADVLDVDHEAVISVKNGVMLAGGVTLDNAACTAYLAGATAACPLTGSLTNASYIGAVDVDQRFTKSQQETLARTGQMVFLPPASDETAVTIQKDINTLVNFTSEKTYALSKNKIIRILYDINNFVTAVGKRFIGTMPNNDNGRSQLKAIVLEGFREREAKGVLKYVTPEDITIDQGKLIDSVVAQYGVKAVDVMEVFYDTIVVQG